MSRAQAELFLAELEQIRGSAELLDTQSRLADLAQDVRSATLPAHFRTKLIRALTDVEHSVTMNQAATSFGQPVAPLITQTAKPHTQEDVIVKMPTQSQKTEQSISYNNETIRTDEFEGTGVVLIDCAFCPLIELQGDLKYLRMYRSDNVTVVAGSVQTSVTLEDCVSSTIHLRCQQLRMHNLSDCGIYGLVRQPPLMENCQRCTLGEISGLLGGRQTGGRILEAEEL